jgi:hypothetical protein
MSANSHKKYEKGKMKSKLEQMKLIIEELSKECRDSK